MINFILNNNNYFEDFITRSTYHSNAIEGSTLTYAETYAIIFNDNSFKISNKEPREIYEAINHKKAMLYLLNLLKEKSSELNEKVIKEINRIINKDIKEISGYRNVDVIIRGSSHIPPKNSEITNLMLYYIYNYNNEVYNDIFEKIAKYHIEFEKIHPFEGGNGRTGRLLINFELLKNNIAPVVIDKEKRVEYFEYLRNEDIVGLSNFLKSLSDEELERMKRLGY